MQLSHIVNGSENPVKVEMVGGSGGSFGGSFETDSEGEPVLRIVDAAPFSYDANTDTLKVTVQGSKYPKTITSSISNTPAGESQLFEIVPPPRKVWVIQNLNLDIRSISTATSGTHQVFFRLGANSSRNDLLRGQTAYNKNIFYKYGMLDDSVTTQLPSEKTMQDRINGIAISEDNPLYILYQNQTNAVQSSTAFAILSVIEEGEL